MPASTLSVPNGASSDEVIAILNRGYGAVKYNQQNSKRYQFYYNYLYPLAGAPTVPFFGTSKSQSTEAITNIDQPSNFGSVGFLIQAIYLDFYIGAANQPIAYTADTGTLYADLMHGLGEAGYFMLQVGQTTWLEMPRPLQTMPPGNGRMRMVTAGNRFTFTQAGGTPFAVTDTSAGSLTYADLDRRADGKFNLQNAIFIAPQQSFDAKIVYDVGAVPILATSLITGGNPLYLRCTFDGWLYEPLS